MQRNIVLVGAIGAVFNLSTMSTQVKAQSELADRQGPSDIASESASPSEAVTTLETEATSGAMPPSTEPAASSGELSTVPVSVKEDDKPEEKADRTVRNRVIEEIVVTAQKREENLQDVPISIQAFSGEALQARGIADTSGLAQSVPSLNFTQVEGFTLIYIRGLGTDNFIPSADPSVATYLDGIYVPQGAMTVNSLGGVERVEVLKGPQGTLFGRNATGGAISLVTADPGSEFEASASASAGNFDMWSVGADVSGPVTDWLSVGLSGLYSKQDSYYTNINYKIDPTELSALRLKLAFRPSENLTIALTGYYSDQQSAGTTIGNNIRPTLLGAAVGIRPQPDSYVSNYDYPIGATSKQKIGYGIVTYKMPSFDLKFLGAAEFIGASSNFDFDSSDLPLVHFSADSVFTRVQTGEFQILSNDDSWMADRLKWVGGIYLFHSVGGFDPAHARVAPNAIESAVDSVNNRFGTNLLALPGLQGLLDSVGQLFPNSPIGDQGIALRIGSLLETSSRSAFAQSTYSFADWIDFTLGGRVQHEERHLQSAQTFVENPTGDGAIKVLSFDVPGESSNTFTPRAVFSLHLGELNNQLLYASYTKGFKSGTFNVISIYSPPNYIEPEKVETYEIGGKFELLNGNLRLNSAAFWNDITNLQTGIISLATGGAVKFESVPKARTRGFEFDMTLLPLPDLDPGLVLTANAAYVDAKYLDYPMGGGFNQTTGIFGTNFDFTGNSISRTPKYSGGAGLIQTIDLDNGTLEMGTDAFYSSGFYFDAQNAIKQPEYVILNANVSYYYTPWKTRVTLFAKNVLDERYHVQEFQIDFGLASTLAAPREFGLRLKYDF